MKPSNYSNRREAKASPTEKGGINMKYLLEVQQEVIKAYRVTICPKAICTCWHRMHAHVKKRMVCKWEPHNSVQNTFDLFHEIGHIETNTAGMRRAEEEYSATMWAIERCREYGIKIPRKLYNEYQEYIDWTRERGERRGGKAYGEMTLPTDVVAE